MIDFALESLLKSDKEFSKLAALWDSTNISELTTESLTDYIHKNVKKCINLNDPNSYHNDNELLLNYIRYYFFVIICIKALVEKYAGNAQIVSPSQNIYTLSPIGSSPNKTQFYLGSWYLRFAGASKVWDYITIRIEPKYINDYSKQDSPYLEKAVLIQVSGLTKTFTGLEVLLKDLKMQRLVNLLAAACEH